MTKELLRARRDSLEELSSTLDEHDMDVSIRAMDLLLDFIEYHYGTQI